MRIYRDMDLVEQLGSGVPRILQSYGEECFYFSENFIRMSFPAEKVTKKLNPIAIGLKETGFELFRNGK